MKITEVKYAMTRVTKQYENDRAEVAVALEPGDSVSEAYARARSACAEALDTSKRESDLRERIKVKMSTPHGREQLERFLSDPKPF